MAEHDPTIVILASGGGSTAETFIENTQLGLVAAEVGLVICNNTPENAGVYERIDALNTKYNLDIPVVKINGITHPSGKGEKGEQTLEEAAAICEIVADGNFDLVALMGYMKKVRGDLLEEYGETSKGLNPHFARMLNTHPGPLPQTAKLVGIHAQEEVLRLGLGYSAHTVHVVTGEYDEGSVLQATPVLVRAGDTPQSLFDRVQEVEKAVLPGVIARFWKERLLLRQRVQGMQEREPELVSTVFDRVNLKKLGL